MIVGSPESIKSQPKLPRVLTREDFDSDEEFARYQSNEAGEWVSTQDREEQRQGWEESALQTIHENRLPIRKNGRRRFHLLLIKPSHYDDAGYVIQWLRSSLPSNSLAAVYGIARDAAARKVLGEDIEIRIRTLDETNSRVDVKRLARAVRRDGGKALVGLVGVQSNQYPRALDLGRRFRAAALPVVIGGFHVSGCLAMLEAMPVELKEALDLGISLFAGELEGRLDDLLRDAARGQLRPVYDFLSDLPDLRGTPAPYLPPDRVRLTMGKRASFDAGRGCPYLCSFCTIINVQGRKSRHRTADDVERLVRTGAQDGITNFFITDDNFARNRNWEAIFDRLIALRASGMELRLVTQVDTQSHRIPGFIEKAGKAGVTRTFIGMESINPDALKGARKGQNKITDYRALLQAWHRAGVLTYAGYIIGFPNDTPQSIRRDIEIIKRELPVDILEFFVLTPLPGSQDHQRLVEQGVPLDPDLNNYDTQHVTMDHPRMSKAEWEGIYREAWDLYYTEAHVATVLRRARAWGYDPENMMAKLFAFHAPVVHEGMHPLEGGLIRRKVRRDRRPGFPIENPLVFYPKLAWEHLNKFTGAFRMHRRYRRILARVLADPDPEAYTDIAMAPVGQSGEDRLALFTATDSAQEFVNKQRALAAKRVKTGA
ncbi:B12-binding domain-containing radical SAM protein [Candidatus Thiosymbion oneisti]|uniref:B12-binding domain-containing radical SAM protein n=1 Tax=Candidatus Thiosymbion oneisti TaxID=589554 RepID=UPI000B7EB91F|nr:radical SAM protein [Candidatus Thiosymbion oneisti]